MFYINTKPPLYNPSAVQPMRDELTHVGFKELLSPRDVDEVLNINDGKTTLVLINSVCGCAAGSARPGVSLALQNNKIPERLTTIFAGLDRDAVDFFRMKYVSEYPPSSPSLFIIKDGKVIYDMSRYQFEGREQEELAEELKNVFNEHCTGEGPSISKEELEKLVRANLCGCKINQNN